jgi:hypothetical protein
MRIELVQGLVRVNLIWELIWVEPIRELLRFELRLGGIWIRPPRPIQVLHVLQVFQRIHLAEYVSTMSVCVFLWKMTEIENPAGIRSLYSPSGLHQLLSRARVVGGVLLLHSDHGLSRSKRGV